MLWLGVAAMVQCCYAAMVWCRCYWLLWLGVDAIGCYGLVSMLWFAVDAIVAVGWCRCYELQSLFWLVVARVASMAAMAYIRCYDLVSLLGLHVAAMAPCCC
jgi:hypothetical protein